MHGLRVALVVRVSRTSCSSSGHETATVTQDLALTNKVTAALAAPATCFSGVGTSSPSADLRASGMCRSVLALMPTGTSLAGGRLRQEVAASRFCFAFRGCLELPTRVVSVLVNACASGSVSDEGGRPVPHMRIHRRSIAPGDRRKMSCALIACVPVAFHLRAQTRFVYMCIASSSRISPLPVRTPGNTGSRSSWSSLPVGSSSVP
jgi:hypothetical protein